MRFNQNHKILIAKEPCNCNVHGNEPKHALFVGKSSLRSQIQTGVSLVGTESVQVLVF